MTQIVKCLEACVITELCNSAPTLNIVSTIIDYKVLILHKTIRDNRVIL